MCGSIGEYEHERTEQVNMCRSSASALNSTTLLSGTAFGMSKFD